ncbi:MAG: S8 family serine peptidase [Candidatus Altiarchaeota archaeon]
MVLSLLLTGFVSAYYLTGGTDEATLNLTCISRECSNLSATADLESKTSVGKALDRLESASLTRLRDKAEFLVKSRIWEKQGIILDYRKIPKDYWNMTVEFSRDSKIASLNSSIGFVIQFWEPPALEYRTHLLSALNAGEEDSIIGKLAQKAAEVGIASEDEIADFGARLYSQGLRESHAKAIAELTPKVRAEYTNVFNGISVEASPDEALKLASLPNVKAVYPIRQYHTMLYESVPAINADDVWLLNDSQNRSVTGYGVTVAVIDTGVDYTHTDFGGCSNRNITGNAENYSLNSSHPYNDSFDYTWTITMPGYSSIAVHFSRLEVESGYDHVYVMNSSNSILDDYSGSYSSVWSSSAQGDTIKVRLTSDAMVAGWGFSIDQIINGSTVFSWNCPRIVGGYDFVNNDSDSMDDNGHGTHVAGTVGANSSAIRGVAPDASMLAYKVCDSGGSCATDHILAGIDRAVDPNQDGNYSDKADIISMSLGGSGDPDDDLSQAVDTAVDNGIVVIVAAGNNGPFEETIACPGCARKAIAVGAVYKSNITTGNRESRLTVESDDNRELQSNAFQYSNTTAAYGISEELYDAGLGYAVNYTSNASGKTALIGRGSMNSTEFYFYEKVNIAHDAGAVAAIIYNNEPGNFLGTLMNDSSIPAVSISQANGTYLLDLMDNGTVRVNLTVTPEYTIMAEFSSRGPSYIYQKPDVVAPGVDICSTQWGTAWSDDECIDDQHTAISGTSMATPHVAGVAALILQQHPTWTPLEVKAALENTAYDYGLDRNVQGAGRVDAYAAVTLNSTPPVAALYDISTVEYK